MEYQYLDATPCPVTWKRNDAKIPIFEDILDSYDDTAEIDFMAELGSLNSLAREKPRRAKKATMFKIHEDSGSSGGSNGGQKPLYRESSMFSQPAQRFPRSAFKAPAGENSSPKVPVKKQQDDFKENSSGESPTSLKFPHGMQKPVKEQKMKKAGRTKRDKRRNTIYIPPDDDTTMATIFMDAFSPLKTQDFGCQELGYIETQILKKRQQQKTTSPIRQRQPLEAPKRIMQELVDQPDVMGKNTGKENVPPGKSESGIAEVTGKKDVLAEASTQPMKSRSVNSPRPRASLSKQKQSVSKSSASRATHSQSSARRTTLTSSRSPRTSPATKQRKEYLPLNTTLLINPISKRKSPSELLPTLLLAPKIEIKHPALHANLADPLIHEETWLSHQEVVITQLVNTLLDTANGQCNTQGQDCLKQQLFDIYQDTYFSLLSKRVQASLLYGDLRVTEDSSGRRRRLTTDARIRRTFTKFWTDTYDIVALQTAAEVVIGREVGYNPHGGNISASPQIFISQDEKGTRRAVESFLDAMLIRNEDMSQDNSSKSSVGDSSDVVKGYHRTALRSIMIIALLDKARMAPDTALPRSLFKPDSAYTSSTAAMRALGPVLLHPQTDFTRPLARLDCSLMYKQHPVAEYNYHIDNIAVDIRDGVILARLTELLLLEHFPERFHAKDKEIWPLSGQLKMPCISRATKVHNARISLSALTKDFPSIGSTITGIKPEDIVDGYREKTIALLWVIVGKWGLSTLVDWDDLKSEIARLEKKLGRLSRKQSSLPPCHVQTTTTDTAAYHSGLLHRWASCLARLKGLEVSNLTTSLADGHVFMSILDEYEHFIRPGSHGVKADKETSATASAPTKTPTSSTDNKSALRRRLLSLGCSSQFVLLSAAAQTSLSSCTHARTTTVAASSEEASNLTALAFLSSRLLSASKYGRAAVTIQRAWRHMLATRPVIDLN
ncbi:calmodulin-binding protein Sha1, putative [Trichophyton verrucosum HKI 0517]|uniref:Calmodulin-binding protein Sha1, putative n=1 Tax=Trichophyton verrucosum (strain HKI 0517) TaxID=663202 RepID=D4D9M6_TRIVH|nr:calmodulin-binding protein Sha1, putative [Trichophyton verrucosum HKI 0517]EFE41460.1 calmodulin-binding protein Sha1, putative [Trichophyton verrucosum HKI 0517]